MQVNVWIVEDDEFLREGYKQLIQSSDSFLVTATFKKGEEAIKQLKIAEPEMILMDIELPGKNGVECTKIIKEKYPNVMIVMVTVHEDSDQVFNSLKAGASGYITKSSNYYQLLKGLEEIRHGGAPISSKIAKMVIESFHINYNSPLTKREAQILQEVATGKTFTQIAEELFISRETTKTHVRNIYRKLEVASKADAIAKATKNHLI